MERELRDAAVPVVRHPWQVNPASALVEVRREDVARAGREACESLWLHSAESLLKTLPKLPPRPKDRRISPPTSCGCEHCRKLAQACRRPVATEVRFSLSFDLRRHISDVIINDSFDISRTTDQSSRQHTLVCTKALKSWERKAANFNRHVKLVRQLDEVAPPGRFAGPGKSAGAGPGCGVGASRAVHAAIALATRGAVLRPADGLSRPTGLRLACRTGRPVLISRIGGVSVMRAFAGKVLSAVARPYGVAQPATGAGRRAVGRRCRAALGSWLESGNPGGCRPREAARVGRRGSLGSPTPRQLGAVPRSRQRPLEVPAGPPGLGRGRAESMAAPVHGDVGTAASSALPVPGGVSGERAVYG